MKKALVIIIVILAIAGIGIYAYMDYLHSKAMLYPKFYSGNGRLEATEIYVSSKLAGRIEKIFVKEGSLVHKGDKLVQMQTDILVAKRDATKAKIKALQGELAMAKAMLKAKKIALSGDEKEYLRQKSLLGNKATAQKTFEQAETKYNNAVAGVEYAEAEVLASEGRIEEQKAVLKEIEADIRDSLLLATYEGRIQYRLAHDGEVLAAGGRVLNLVNLTDSYITFFLPTKIAGQVKMGADVRIIFDACPDCCFTAKVTFIDPVAQFTPKSVETRVEREKLMFRVKAHLNADLLRKYISEVKTGLPGVAWVRIDPNADWNDCPESLPKTDIEVEKAYTSAAGKAEKAK